MYKLFFIKDIKKSSDSCHYFGGKKKYIATADVQNSAIISFELVDFKSKPSRANLITSVGSVLFAKMQNTIKVIRIDESNCNNIYSTGFYSFKDERILPMYLEFYFKSNIFNRVKDENCQGATMKAINDEAMSNIYILVPSITEQNKIVRELLAISKMIQKNVKLIEKLDNIVKIPIYRDVWYIRKHEKLYYYNV